MTQSDMEQRRRSMVQTLLIVVIGQVGCLTLVVILASVFGGLWLDSYFGTKPMFTLVLLFAGIPISVFLMLWLSRKALAQLKEKYETEDNKTSA
ncbi:MAG: AtpZ/AtpI family protein [Anaerolineales bacterium]|nr:AtpZ/AtpI family protein [Anaerolineales bacterium]